MLPCFGCCSPRSANQRRPRNLKHHPWSVDRVSIYPELSKNLDMKAPVLPKRLVFHPQEIMVEHVTSPWCIVELDLLSRSKRLKILHLRRTFIEFQPHAFSHSCTTFRKNDEGMDRRNSATAGRGFARLEGDLERERETVDESFLA